MRPAVTIQEFRTWLSVLAAAGAKIPAALALRRLEETVEEAGGEDERQTQPDLTLEETLELVRQVVSSGADEAGDPEVNPDPEPEPNSLWMGPFRKFDWVLEPLPETVYADPRWTIVRYPQGRVEAIDRRRGTYLTLRHGTPFPGPGRIGQADVPEQDTVALYLMEDNALMWVRPSMTDVALCTIEVQREILLLADHRPWTMYYRRGNKVSNLGPGYLWIDDDGGLYSGHDIPDTDEPLYGAVC